MKKILFLIIYLGITISSYAQISIVKGRIIDERLDNLMSAQITNLRTLHKTMSDSNGFYHINAGIGDTLKFYFIGSTQELRVVASSFLHINVLLMNKTVNDLGAIWTKNQWEVANRQAEKKYKNIENKAELLGMWKY